MKKKWITQFGLIVLTTLGSVGQVLAHTEAEQKVLDQNLATFDDLDFNVYSTQKWGDFTKSHHDDILVHWPDGHTTKGLARHIEDLKYQFTFAPDTRIVDHPAKVAQGEWTAVTGTMEGTFSKPMKTPDGKSIKPTGKKFKIPMATFGHWKNGKMDEEFLFWDNMAFMKQIGLAK